MLANKHPEFKIRGITARLTEDAPQLTQQDLEEDIREVRRNLVYQYGEMERKELKQLEMLQPFIRYFKSYKKTYHLFLQLESFIHKDKPLPFITPLVSAYFLAELETGVLASAHDLDKIIPGLSLTAAEGGETLTLINGEERSAPAGDALLKDSEGLLTCVIQGQDSRTVLGPGSRNAAYFVYGPSGVSDQELTAALTVLSDHLTAWYGDLLEIEEIPRAVSL